MAVLLGQHHRVVGVDVDDDRVELLRSGRSPISDPELEDYLARARARPDLHDRHRGVRRGRLRRRRHPDRLRPGVRLVRHHLGRGRDPGGRGGQPAATMVVKSTVPVGFVEDVRTAARHRPGDLLPRVPARGEGAPRQPAPLPHRRRREVRPRPPLRRHAGRGLARAGRARPAHRPDRRRGDQALLQHLPRDADRVLQRARLVRDRPRAVLAAGDRGRRARPADRHPLQQPVVRVRRLLPAQGHPAAAGQLLERPAEPDPRDRRRQHHPQGLHRRRHPQPGSPRSSASTGSS